MLGRKFIFVAFVLSIVITIVKSSNFTVTTPIAVNTYKDSNLAVVSASNNGTYILNISNPFIPTLISHMLPAKFGYMYSGYIYGNYLYATSYDKVVIYDITNLANPINISTIVTGTGTTSLVKDGNILFVNSGYIGFKVYDVTNPASPVQTYNSSLILVYDVVKHPTAKVVYVSITDYVAAYIYSSANDVTPFKNVTVGTKSFLSTICYMGNCYLFVTNPNNTKIYDITDPTQMNLIGSPIAAGNGGLKSMDVKVIGDSIIFAVSNNSGSIDIYNLTNPSQPTIINSLTDGNNTIGVSLFGNIIFYCSYNDNRVIITQLNISDVSSSVTTSQITTSDTNSATTSQNQLTTSTPSTTSSTPSSTTSSVQSTTSMIQMTTSVTTGAEESNGMKFQLNLFILIGLIAIFTK